MCTSLKPISLDRLCFSIFDLMTYFICTILIYHHGIIINIYHITRMAYCVTSTSVLFVEFHAWHTISIPGLHAWRSALNVAATSLCAVALNTVWPLIKSVTKFNGLDLLIDKLWLLFHNVMIMNCVAFYIFITKVEQHMWKYYRPHQKDEGRKYFQSVHTCGG